MSAQPSPAAVKAAKLVCKQPHNFLTAREKEVLANKERECAAIIQAAIDAETRALRKDEERLDWLETGPVLPMDCSADPNMPIEWQRARLTRAAIDAAMQDSRFFTPTGAARGPAGG
jgi:hypothetical protein